MPKFTMAGAYPPTNITSALGMNCQPTQNCFSASSLMTSSTAVDHRFEQHGNQRSTSNSPFTQEYNKYQIYSPGNRCRYDEYETPDRPSSAPFRSCKYSIKTSDDSNVGQAWGTEFPANCKSIENPVSTQQPICNGDANPSAKTEGDKPSFKEPASAVNR
jgi:hypothetical protein